MRVPHTASVGAVRSESNHAKEIRAEKGARGGNCRRRDSVHHRKSPGRQSGRTATLCDYVARYSELFYFLDYTRTPTVTSIVDMQKTETPCKIDCLEFLFIYTNTNVQAIVSLTSNNIFSVSPSQTIMHMGTLLPQMQPPRVCFGASRHQLFGNHDDDKTQDSS